MHTQTNTPTRTHRHTHPLLLGFYSILVLLFVDLEFGLLSLLMKELIGRKQITATVSRWLTESLGAPLLPPFTTRGVRLSTSAERIWKLKPTSSWRAEDLRVLGGLAKVLLPSFWIGQLLESRLTHSACQLKHRAEPALGICGCVRKGSSWWV